MMNRTKTALSLFVFGLMFLTAGTALRRLLAPLRLAQQPDFGHGRYAGGQDYVKRGRSNRPKSGR